MRKKRPKGPQPQAAAKDFVEIGGSPVPGLTLRYVLRGQGAGFRGMDWSPDGTTLGAGSDDGTIRLWDAASGTERRTLQGHGDAVHAVSWSPNGRTLASGSYDKTIRLWDPASGKALRTLRGHEKGVNSVLWSPDGAVLASLSSDATIRLWDADNGDADNGKEISKLREPDGYIPYTMSWSPDSGMLASGSYDHVVRLWDASSGDAIRLLRGHQSIVRTVSWSPDGRTLASGSADKTVRLWDAVTGQQVSVWESHTGSVTSVRFSPDGRLLASRSDDNQIRLWSADTGTPLAVLGETPTGTINIGLAFHPHEPILATLGENDRIIRIWDLDIDVLLGSAAESVRYTTAKIVLVGDSGVGKTGLGWRLAHGAFKEHASTHGQQFWVIDALGTKRKDGTECEAVLWDLAGQHVYRPVHAIFLDDVDGALILFDPTNRQEPLKGAQFWLEQLAGKTTLPPAVLVGARLDRGTPALSQGELHQFCQRYGIGGGYIGTSSKSGEGLEKLLETLSAQIPWDRMTTTVTTVTFKRIKDHVLALKERPDRRGVLVRPADLRSQLEEADHGWKFADAEMMTAVKHLENHGYVAVLRTSSGEEAILLTPELLVDLASSIVLQADKHPRDLGALSETALLQGDYPFPELAGLEPAEGQVLIDAAVARFLDHNICFRETLGAETLLIFPGLIKQKRPLLDEVDTVEDVSYIVRGRVENIYAALVVLLGYTPTFTRVNLWQSQVQYEMGAGEISGFRLIEEREGEIEVVLYYSPAMPDYGRTMFQGLFEKFLYQRDVEVTRFAPIVCPNGHRQERATVVKRLLDGKRSMYCDECGKEVTLPEIEKPLALGGQPARRVQREEALARLRGAYETHLVRIKGFRRDRTAPRCYISHLPEQATWVAQLAGDLREAGVYMVEDRTEVQPGDSVVVVCTPAYRQAWDRGAGPVAADAGIVGARIRRAKEPWPTLIPLLREGDSGTACPGRLRNRVAADFREETLYAVRLFDLVLSLYAISLGHPAFTPSRDALRRQWGETLGDDIAGESLSGDAGFASADTDSIETGPEVFLSYAWGGESEALADELDKAFQARSVTIVRDKRDLGFRGRIKSFMATIGRGRCVILVIGEKYLKSENCLFELLEVAKHGDFDDRVFPVVLEDVRIYRPVDRLRYVRHWERQLKELDAAMKTVSQANLQGFREDIDLYAEIRAQLPRLADILKDMNALTPAIHRESDFAALFEAVISRLSA